ncbi:N-acetylglucosamine-6-phosphate deacetylase [Sphingobacterium rhinopitheci]|uniref:N-acetylglucosamine-6-phosphate deacetylase n=1 Tax=Sphingobacterium rhinopitheci TaxID=2781960 RepID=UPI001F51CD27|nr:N-acetylglucosamine-6-phosphate deacetylase [Sphingobacterium rhinopitheci]MCI0920503.1 N-acetylglucosamine-6-phosphate deacetylase [Sphingobacterium rhinopitheci]
MNKPIALYNGTIYTNYDVLFGQSILIKDGLIEDIVDANTIPDQYEKYDLKGATICPGLIDLQIYGTGSDLYSADLTSECIQRIENNLLKQGCTTFYLTLATNSIALFKEAISIFKSSTRRSAAGLHLEGPFLNEKKRGAHPADLVIPIAVPVLVDLLSEADDVVKIMTVAPELANIASLDYLKEKNILVSAGHSNATFEQATAAFDAGIPAVTHLWNAMSPLHHRDMGVPGATFNHDTVCASIIVDGIHVDYDAVKLSKKMMGERLFLITDAVASCSTSVYQHILNGDHYILPDGTLSGSALSLLMAIENCVKNVNMDIGEAIRMATLYPARLMKLQDVGQLKKGFRANITAFDHDFNVKAVFLDGEKVV